MIIPNYWYEMTNFISILIDSNKIQFILEGNGARLLLVY